MGRLHQVARSSGLTGSPKRKRRTTALPHTTTCFLLGRWTSKYESGFWLQLREGRPLAHETFTILIYIYISQNNSISETADTIYEIRVIATLDGEHEPSEFSEPRLENSEVIGIGRVELAVFQRTRCFRKQRGVPSARSF